MVLSAIGAAVGAIMFWAVTYQGTGFRPLTVALILMIAGAFGFVVSAIVFAVSRSPSRSTRHSIVREVVHSSRTVKFPSRSLQVATRR
jgi:phosphate/sulfate permease